MELSDDTPLFPPEGVGLGEFLIRVTEPFLAALERIDDIWQGQLTLEAATRLVNEAAVNLGVMVSVIEMNGRSWQNPVDDLGDGVDWIDGFVTRLLSVAAAAATGVRLTAPPGMDDDEATIYSFTLVGAMLEHERSSDPLRLHLAVLNAVGKLMRHQRLLVAADEGDAAALAELREISEEETDATRSLALVFMVVAAAALAAVYRLRPRSPLFVSELDERLARPPAEPLR